MADLEVWKEFFIAALQGRTPPMEYPGSIIDENEIVDDAARIADLSFDIYNKRRGKV